MLPESYWILLPADTECLIVPAFTTTDQIINSNKYSMKKLKTSLWILLALVVVIILSLPLLLNEETKTLNPDTRKEAPGQFIALTNGMTHYEAFGPDTAQTVLLVHGFSVPFYIWDQTFEFLIQEGFHVIRFDLFGRGYSDRPDVVYNGELFKQQIADLLTALKIDKPVDIIGLSMGGPIATEFTTHYPEKVRKLTLIAPFNEPFDISVLEVPVLGDYLANVYFVPSLSKSQLEDFSKPEEHAEWPEKFKPQMKYKGFTRALLSTLRNYMNKDQLHVFVELGKLNKQVLLIWGENDKTTPFRGNVRIREVVECKFLSIEEAGHLPHIENSEIVNFAISGFLNNAVVILD
jgi:pimeloyl-ACP methyl ester carboxylesterase